MLRKSKKRTRRKKVRKKRELRRVKKPTHW